jgi:beta-lactamase regulating signal transducer with metallopeptidase domain
MTRLVEIGFSNAVMATVLAVLAAVLCRICRRPAFAHGLWLLVLLKLLTPPLVSVPLPWFDDAGNSAVDEAAPDAGLTRALPDDVGVVEDARADDEIQPALAELEAGSSSNPQAGTGFIPPAWIGAAFWAWLAGAVFCLVWIACSTYRFQRLLCFARPAGAEVQELVTELTGRLHLRRPPRVWLVPGAVSPMLWACACRARLLFPARLLESLDRDKLQTLLAHELAHWHRRDHWLRFLELVVQVIYWWHPAVWWIRAELHEAEEQCCDAWVVAALAGADRTYALALLETAAFVSHTRPILPATASGIGQVPHLRRRLTMIMSGQTHKTLNWAGALGLASLGLALLPLVPGRAQDTERRPLDPTAEQKAQLDAARSALERQLQGLRIAVQTQQAQTQQTPIDEQIEALRRALQILEEQKRKGQGSAPKSASPDEIKKAHDEVVTLADLAKAKRDDLRKAEVALQKAQARLAKLQGKTATAVWRYEALNLTRPVQVQVVPAETRIRSLAPITLPPAGVGVARPDDLRQRLDRLLREVEELRREIQQGRRTGAAPIRGVQPPVPQPK